MCAGVRSRCAGGLVGGVCGIGRNGWVGRSDLLIGTETGVFVGGLVGRVCRSGQRILSAVVWKVPLCVSSMQHGTLTVV